MKLCWGCTDTFVRRLVCEIAGRTCNLVEYFVKSRKKIYNFAESELYKFNCNEDNVMELYFLINRLPTNKSLEAASDYGLHCFN